jgi:hypothetical protein
MSRVILPAHLRTLGEVGTEVTLEVSGPVTQQSILDALEAGKKQGARLGMTVAAEERWRSSVFGDSVRSSPHVPTPSPD